MSALSGNSFANALKTNPIVNDSIVKRLHQLFLIKFTTDNLVPFLLYCVFWRFSGRNCNISKNFLCKLRLITFAEGKLYLEMPTQFLISNLGSRYSRIGLLHKMDRKSESLTFFGIKSSEQFLLEFRVVTNWEDLRIYLYPLSSM